MTTAKQPIFRIITAAVLSVCIAGLGQNTAAAPEWPSEAGGFASVEAMGQDGTTGGAGGEVVTVTGQAALEKYAAKEEPYVIRVKGPIEIIPKGKEINVNSDTTIVGVGKSGDIVGGGFYLTAGVHNVILRNLTIRDTYIGDPDGKVTDHDGLQIDTAHHVWVDHCRIESHADGGLDSRRQTTHLTVSWTVFRDINKCFGIGWAQGNQGSHVTIHHTGFHNTKGRNPSVTGVLRGHLYNNYYKDVKCGVTIYHGTSNANLLLENIFFEDTMTAHKPNDKDPSRSSLVANN